MPDLLFKDLTSAHETLCEKLSVLSAPVFEFQPAPEKWSPAQHGKHILKSIRPVAQGLSLPLFVPRLLFGPPKHEPMNYDRVVKQYQKKLAEGLVAPAPFIPKKVTLAERDVLLATIRSTTAALVKDASKRSDTQLDGVCFPHPSLGRISIREMLFFSLYHVRHHTLAIEKLVAEAC
jgi:hypothetical protein